MRPMPPTGALATLSSVYWKFSANDAAGFLAAHGRRAKMNESDDTTFSPAAGDAYAAVSGGMLKGVMTCVGAAR